MVVVGFGLASGKGDWRKIIVFPQLEIFWGIGGVWECLLGVK